MISVWMQAYLKTHFPSYARALEAAAHEPEWVRWYYAPDEWARLDEALWKSAMRRAMIYGLAGAGLTALLFAGSALAFADLTNRLVAWGLVGTAGAVSLAAVIGYERLLYNRATQARVARQRGPRGICVGPLAIHLPGQVLPLGGYSVAPPTNSWDPLGAGIDVLQDVVISGASPARIRFTGYPITGRGGRGLRKVITVPVPRGREEEARRLAARFHSEILNSST